MQHIRLYDGTEPLVRPLHYPVMDWSAVQSSYKRGYHRHSGPVRVVYATRRMYMYSGLHRHMTSNQSFVQATRRMANTTRTWECSTVPHAKHIASSAWSRMDAACCLSAAWFRPVDRYVAISLTSYTHITAWWYASTGMWMWERMSVLHMRIDCGCMMCHTNNGRRCVLHLSDGNRHSHSWS